MTAEASQQPVIDFLSDAASYGGTPVKRIDTHVASVFLAGERALKIKRAVRFPFLDFSTLRARRIACETEIAVNRAFAPSLYRRVVAITREINGGFALGGRGEPAQEILVPGKPRLIAIGGLSGTGKSLLARALAPRLHPLPGAVVFRSDLERKALFAAGEAEKLPEAAYTTETTAKVYAVLAEKARRAVSAGHSVIVDAVFAKPSERSEIAGIAPDAFEGLFLNASLDTRLARVATRSGDASDADAIVARKQEDFDLGKIKWTKVDASGTPEETLIRVEAMLEQG